MQHMPMELYGDKILEHEEKNHALLDIGHSINLCVHDPYKKVLESKWIIYVIKKSQYPIHIHDIPNLKMVPTFAWSM